MGDSEIISSCLSAESHEQPRDPILHYLGCLEFCERDEYLNTLTESAAQERIKAELKRIVNLRGVLKSGQDASVSDLVSNLENSMVSWRQSALYQQEYGIKNVQAWRDRRGLQNGVDQRFEPWEKPMDYHPDRDTKAYFISYNEHGNPIDSLPEYKLGGHFPDHKLSVSELLNEGPSNPLHQAFQDPKNKIGYFHLPANNMSWVERAIARYCGESDLGDDWTGKTKAQMLLRPQFWRGQQHGGKSAEIHARHLRPLCEVVSSDHEHVDATPRNVVLFMPYLHWETDRQRENIAHFLDHEEYQNRKKKGKEELQRKNERRIERRELFNPFLGKPGSTPTGAPLRTMLPIPGILKSLSQVASSVPLRPSSRARGSLRSRCLFKSSKNGRVLANPLGQVLIDAARLYEAMMNFRDKMLIREYLYKSPPLHPRRTLDQAYYWTLKTTRARDRDQVIYRGTRPDPPHSIGLETKEWTCFHEDADESRKDDNLDKNRKEKFCVHCANHVRKVSRILMVDQLWMWILDEKTIITAFPKRYGLNKQDPTGVHKSIRDRLQNLRPGHIKTVFDLALIILEELTNVFFDRTKTTDQQPEVLNIFSEAIGNINNKQTLSYEHLWDWTRRLAKVASPGAIPTDLSHFVAPLLNISTEGGLQREIKDVIDELNIMIYLQSQQLEVIKSFKKQAEALLSARFHLGSPPTSPLFPAIPASAQINKASDLRSGNKNFDWFQRMSQDLVVAVEGRIAELQTLKDSAESTSASLVHLLGLKQQQAAVVQAWQSVQQAEEAVKQGRAIMVFTVITIIFLPLAFIASIFGMNNKEVSGDSAPMTLQEQFQLMFPISIGLIIIVLVLAYSGFVRTLVWLAYRYLVTFMVVKTPIYDRVYLSLDWGSTSLTRKVEEKVRDMKLLAKRNKRKRIWKKIQEDRQEDIKAEELAKKKEKHQPHQDGQKRRVSPNAEANGTSSPNQSTATTTATQNSGQVGVHWASPHTISDRQDAQEPSRGDLESGTDLSHRRRPFLRPFPPAFVSEGVQTTPSLIVDGDLPSF